MIRPEELVRVKHPEDPKDQHIVLHNDKEVTGFNDGALKITFEDTPGEIQTQLDKIKEKYPMGFDENFIKYATRSGWLVREGNDVYEFIHRKRPKSNSDKLQDLRMEHSVVPNTQNTDGSMEGSERTYQKLNRLDSDSKYSKEDYKMINWKRKAEKLDPAKYLSEGQKGDIKLNPPQEAFKVSVSQPKDKSPQDSLSKSMVVDKSHSQFQHSTASQMVSKLDAKIAELTKIRDQIKVQADQKLPSNTNVDPASSQFREEGKKEKLNYNPGEAKADPGKQMGITTEKGDAPLSKSMVEKLEHPTPGKDLVKEIPQSVKTEKADGFKDKGTKEKIMPNKSFHSDSDTHQQTDKNLGKKFYTGEEKAKPFQKQFAAVINWVRKADMPAMPADMTLSPDVEMVIGPDGKKLIRKKADVAVEAAPEMKMDMPKLELPKAPKMEKLPEMKEDKPKAEKKDESKKEEKKEDKAPKMDKMEKDEEEYLAGECLKEDLEEVMDKHKDNDEVKALLKDNPDLVKTINKLADMAIKLEKAELDKSAALLVDADQKFASWNPRRVRKHWASLSGNTGTPSERLEKAIASLKGKAANPEAYASALFNRVYNTVKA